MEESYSISAGLDFPSVGPQHALFAGIGRAEYQVSLMMNIKCFQALANMRGFIPALETPTH